MDTSLGVVSAETREENIAALPSASQKQAAENSLVLTEPRVPDLAISSRVAEVPLLLQPPLLSIIVPTKNEAGNIHLLLSRLEAATRGIPTEVIFVDDSTDNTAEIIGETCGLFPLRTQVIIRPPERRNDGLGGAVLEGLRAASGSWVCVMDGDLQHPPELIPQLLAEADTTQADVVIASRRNKISRNKGLNPLRTFVSRTLDIMARAMFPAHLRKVQDPLTGFFLVRRQAIDVDRLRPQGFKILLEILVRFPGLKVGQIPFEFGARHAGKSKASAKEVYKYLSLLMRLRFGDEYQGVVKFGLVGATGIIVNSVTLFALTDRLGVYYLVSAAFASVASSTWNFMFTEYWVFRHRQERHGIGRRFVLFFVLNNAALILREPIIAVLTDRLGIYYLISNLVSLILLVLARYAVSDTLIWARQKPGRRVAPRRLSSGTKPAV
ncbi:MAG: glycosyltransferase family 2 protein [Chloroflexi bacterium]|nr:glycosyltransferase family 2 protein [Chloroflexota bacterium]